MICSIYVCFDHLSTFLCWLVHLRKKVLWHGKFFQHFLRKSIFQTGISQQQSIQITYHFVYTYIIYIVFLLWKIIAVTLTTKKLCWSENVTFRLKCLARAYLIGQPEFKEDWNTEIPRQEQGFVISSSFFLLFFSSAWSLLFFSLYFSRHCFRNPFLLHLHANEALTRHCSSHKTTSAWSLEWSDLPQV